MWRCHLIDFSTFKRWKICENNAEVVMTNFWWVFGQRFASTWSWNLHDTISHVQEGGEPAGAFRTCFISKTCLKVITWSLIRLP